MQEPRPVRPISDPLRSLSAAELQPMEDEAIEAMRTRLNRLINQTDAMLSSMGDSFELSAFPQLDHADLHLRIVQQSSALNAVRERLIAARSPDSP